MSLLHKGGQAQRWTEAWCTPSTHHAHFALEADMQEGLLGGLICLEMILGITLDTWGWLRQSWPMALQGNTC